MQTQAEISRTRLEQRVGSTIQVIVDDVDEEGAFARSKSDAPEIDGIVHIRDGQNLSPGDFADVQVEHSDDYDLAARLAG